MKHIRKLIKDFVKGYEKVDISSMIHKFIQKRDIGFIVDRLVHYEDGEKSIRIHIGIELEKVKVNKVRVIVDDYYCTDSLFRPFYNINRKDIEYIQGSLEKYGPIYCVQIFTTDAYHANICTKKHREDIINKLSGRFQHIDIGADDPDKLYQLYFKRKDSSI